MLTPAALRPSSFFRSQAFRRQGARPWLFLVFLSVWASGCASLPNNVDRPVSTALPNPMETRLGQFVQARSAKAGTHNDSGFALVGNAELALPAG